jgi:hypothetical protein
MSYTFEDFKAGKVAVRCDTREEHDRLMQECEDAGLRWNDGANPTDPGPFYQFEPGHTFALGDVKGKLMQCTQLNRPEDCRGCRGDCGHKNAVPFAEIFPADPWPEFIAGKCYLRVERDEWDKFARRCAMNGIVWQCNIGSAASFLPAFNPYALIRIGGYVGQIMQDVRRDPVPSDRPIRSFSAVLATDKLKVPVAPKPKVGDRIRILRDNPAGAHVRKGDVCTVKVADLHGDGSDSVEIDGGWAIPCDAYEVSTARVHPKIIITTDGRVTTARMFEGKRVVREAKATCSPKDRFDFLDGAAIALQRLHFGPGADALDQDDMREWANVLASVAARIREAINE